MRAKNGDSPRPRPHMDLMMLEAGQKTAVTLGTNRQRIAAARIYLRKVSGTSRYVDKKFLDAMITTGHMSPRDVYVLAARAAGMSRKAVGENVGITVGAVTSICGRFPEAFEIRRLMLQNHVMSRMHGPIDAAIKISMDSENKNSQNAMRNLIELMKPPIRSSAGTEINIGGKHVGDKILNEVRIGYEAANELTLDQARRKLKAIEAKFTRPEAPKEVPGDVGTD